jgi:hypothetical protein
VARLREKILPRLKKLENQFDVWWLALHHHSTLHWNNPQCFPQPMPDILVCLRNQLLILEVVPVNVFV